MPGNARSAAPADAPEATGLIGLGAVGSDVATDSGPLSLAPRLFQRPGQRSGSDGGKRYRTNPSSLPGGNTDPPGGPISGPDEYVCPTGSGRNAGSAGDGANRGLGRVCVPHMLIVSQRHLEAVLGEYCAHYNDERPHRSCGLRLPASRSAPIRRPGATIRRRARLGELLSDYSATPIAA